MQIHISSITVLFILHLIFVRSQSIEIDSECIDCICKATGKCQYPLGCSNVGSGYFCGPLQISWSYWSDGGRLGDKGNKYDFEDCLTTKSCAEQTVRNYMRKYAQDCDGNGFVDCRDFAILHKTGFRQCKQSIAKTNYWKEFTATKCYQQSGNLIREQPINRNIVRNTFTSSSSSSIRNVRRTLSTGPAANHPNNLRGFSRTTFKELDFPTAFDNFDTHDFSSPHNPSNLPASNHRELNIETSSRVLARPTVRVNAANRNNDLINDRKPLNSIRSTPSIPSSPAFKPPAVENLEFSNVTVTIDRKCLDCICHGSTKCNLSMKCSGNFCGPFLISYAYWKEGGQMLNNYVKCANDFNCAKQTVANYMARYNRDCDMNQELTCEDFAIIHQSGGYECEKSSKEIKKSHYYRNFEKCYFNDEFRVFINEDDEPVVGSSIITKPTSQPLVSNQPDTRRNQPRNPIPSEINVTNDWTPIEPFNRNNERTNENREIFNNNNFNSRSINSNLRPPQPPTNLRPPQSNIRPIELSINQPPVNRSNNQPSVNDRTPINNQPPVNRPINQPPVNRPNNQPSVNDRTPLNNQPPVNRPINQPPVNRPNNQPPVNDRTPINNQPITVSNNMPDWIDTSNESSNSENNDESVNENSNGYQPLSRSTRRPARPSPKPFESNEEEVNEQPNIEPTNSNPNSYTSINNSNTFDEPEVIPVENNRRRPSSRATAITTSNVIPVSPAAPSMQSNITIPQSCFDCMCEAITSKSTCNDRQNCFVNSFGEFVCGPYQINRYFWVDSGKPNDNGQADAFEQCASNRECSQQTIAAYVQKHSADCNEDEQIDCIDFAAMVRVGKACKLQNLIDSAYWNRFQHCMDTNYGFGED